MLGYPDADRSPLWDPLSGGHALAFIAVPVAFVLATMAYLPTRTRQFLRHPFSLGILIWSLTHLAVTGHYAAAALFAATALLIGFATGKPATKPGRIGYDVLALVIGLGLSKGMLHAHEWIGNTPLT